MFLKIKKKAPRKILLAKYKLILYNNNTYRDSLYNQCKNFYEADAMNIDETNGLLEDLNNINNIAIDEDYIG